jgi:hypothetical protein
MQSIKNWWYADQYYKITNEGDQKSIYDSSPFEYILHMHKTSKGMQYHFLKPGDSYQIRLPYSVLGLSITINEDCYVLQPSSFLIQGNNLGEIFVLWLCKHYLYRKHGKAEWTIVDHTVMLHQGSTICVNNELKNDIK